MYENIRCIYTHIYIHQKTFFTAECILISQYHENCVHLLPPLTPLPRVTRQIYKNTLLISRQKSQPPPMTSAAWIPFFISCGAPETQKTLTALPLRGHLNISHSIW